jgi:hypothetical protein
MRLNDITECVKEHGMRRYAVKRGFVLPLVAGASAVAATQHGLGTYRDARETLDRASHQQLAPDVARNKTAAPGGLPPGGGGFGASMGQAAQSGVGSGLGSLAGAPLAGAAAGITGSIGDGIKQMLMGRQFGERKDPLHMLGSAAIGSFGKGLGDLGVQLLQDIASKAVAAAGNVGQNAARQAILSQLKQEDSILSQADDRVLMEAYHTMTRFAPTLSTDKNAVRSFLRQAVMSGTGADYSTIKHLADSERAVTGQDRR